MKILKTEKKIEKRLELIVKNKNFAAKYLKNIIVDVCHASSTHALTGSCYICSDKVSAKEIKEGARYGIRFGDFYNKRHQKKTERGSICPKYFEKDICMSCVAKIEEKLDFEFKKSYAP